MSDYKFMYAIILYDSRSGSTYLSSLLNQYEGVKVAVESRFPLFLLEYPQDILKTPAEIKNLLDLLYSEIQFQDMKVNRVILEEFLNSSEAVINKKKVFDTIIKLYFQNDPVSILNPNFTYILKIPVAYKFINSLKKLLGDYQIIHLVRDGRAVFSSKRNSISLKNKAFEKNLIVAALGWKGKIKDAIQITQPILHVRYEDLLDKNTNTIHRILDFLKIEEPGKRVTKSVLDFSSSIGEKQKSFHANVGKTLTNSNTSKWMNELSNVELHLYELIANKELKQFNYPIFEGRNGFKTNIAIAGLGTYFIIQYVADRLSNVVSYSKNGTLKKIVKRKLLETGIIQVK